MSEAHPDTAGAAAAGGAGPLRTGLFILFVLGAVLCVLAALTDGNRFAFAYLWGFAFLWTIVLGSLFIVALHHVTRAVWSVVIRRVAEMFVAPIWGLAVLAVIVALAPLAHQLTSLYPWANPEVVHGDHVLEGKSPYLNAPFFIARAAFFFLVWIGFARFFLRRSLAQDRGEAGEEATRSMRKWSGPFILLFALTVTFASFDWLMSLDPHWFSTIFGVYVFSGMVVSALSAVIIGVVWLRKEGRLGEGIVTDEHLYSLGALLFAFSCFWAYIGFSQFMLIWYGNLPEETFYFVHRFQHGWLAVSVALAFLRFVLPFFLLLSRYAKMNPRRLVLVSILCLVGQLVDLYWLIMPQLHAEGPRLGWQDLGPLLLFVSGLGAWIHLFLKKHKPLAEGDPLFEKSCRFHL